MKIKWFGHSCFLLTADNGVSILIDPFDESVGYKLPEVAADIVSTSHEHFDHNNTEIVQGDFYHLNKTGTFSHKGIEMKGVATYHDEANGEERGHNIIYKYIIDGLHICHCGDLGHTLSEEQIKQIGHVDTLLIPVGGIATIGPEQAVDTIKRLKRRIEELKGVTNSKAVDTIKRLKPSLVIPMHFHTDVLNFTLGKLDHFLEKIGGGHHLGKQEIEFDKNTLSNLPSNVMVLNYE